MRILLVLLLVAVVSAKQYERCEWARYLKNNGIGLAYWGYSLANWVCLTRHESNFNTDAINHNTDGSTDYGIFQINSRWWCDKGDGTPTANGCNIKCSSLLSDDVSVAINCAKRVVRDPNGMSAWVAWRKYCENQDLSPYLAGCGLV
ncbi:lysozyme C-like [Betta splendens]|uniref:lysozyme n=1 Tax=Betta splendens TaxID=158456 RepID=A0A6P7P8K7_BETSP|nr:lysozyme C-like [Betta splendens]